MHSQSSQVGKCLECCWMQQQWNRDGVGEVSYEKSSIKRLFGAHIKHSPREDHITTTHVDILMDPHGLKAGTVLPHDLVTFWLFFVQGNVPTVANHTVPWSWHILTSSTPWRLRPKDTAGEDRRLSGGPGLLSSFRDDLRPWNLDHFRTRFETGEAWEGLTYAIRSQWTQANQPFGLSGMSSLPRDSLEILSHICDCATWNHCRLGKSWYH